MRIYDGMELTEKEVIDMNWNRNVWVFCGKPVHTYISLDKEWSITFYQGQEKTTVERTDE